MSETCIRTKEVLSNKLEWLDIGKSVKVILHIDRLKEKKTCFLNDLLKTDKIQCPVIIRTVSKLEIESNITNWIKGFYQDPQQMSYLMLKHQIRSVPFTMGNETFYSQLYSLLYYRSYPKQ